jgi:hypothetical protein
LPFAKPEAVNALKQRLATEVRPVQAATYLPATAPVHPAESRFPWSLLVMGLILGGAVWFFIRAINRPRQAVPAGYPAAGGYGSNPQPYAGSGYPGAAPAPAGGMGSGILGGLATGAAVGAGMVAGEALMHRVFDGSGGSTSHLGGAASAAETSPLGDPLASPDNFDAGGNDFGISDGGSWDDGSSGGGDWG